MTDLNMRKLLASTTCRVAGVSLVLCALLFCSPGAWAADEVIPIDLGTPAAREATVLNLTAAAAESKAEAEAWAKANGFPMRWETPDGGLAEIVGMSGKAPRILTTHNYNAAISTNAAAIRNTAPYSVNGSSSIVGVWDGGAVLPTHQEFQTNRIIIKDGAASHPHATHVGGTIAATGVVAQAMGMAPLAKIWSYDWDDDLAEIAAVAADKAGQANRIYASNHSYGPYAGWVYSSYFFGNYPDREDIVFGQYNYWVAQTDALCKEAPYYLMFRSAGNDRSDGPPPPGQDFIYLDRISGTAIPLTFDPSRDPYADGWNQGGFDTIPGDGIAKNVMTIGAVSAAVQGGMRIPSVAQMSSFSGWGPTDDGRIKPDIVADGVNVYSSVDDSNSAYDLYSGTSMASPNACGTAQLLIELYAKTFTKAPSKSMRASTLKALIIHTADDMGRPGPDYSFGWGLMNAKAAADHILLAKQYTSGPYITEAVRLQSASGPDKYSIISDGVNPIRVTICWTDPAGPYSTDLNDRTPVLVNDLDIRLVGPGGASQTFSPYVLDIANPVSNATTGDNVVDNVEQIYLAKPPTGGKYTIEVKHKGSLGAGGQVYSLIVSGLSPDKFQVTPSDLWEPIGVEGGPFYPSETRIYTVKNTDTKSINWTAASQLSWVTVAPTNGILAAGASQEVTASLTSAVDTFNVGNYVGNMVFTNTTDSLSHYRGVSLTVEEYRTQPEARNVSLSPSYPGSKDNIEIKYTYFDPNGHAMGGVQTKWFKNNQEMPAYANLLVLPENATSTGESWAAQIRVQDGVDSEWSTWVDAAPVTIMNKLPAFTPIPLQIINEGQTLTLNVVVQDPDDDPITLIANISSLTASAVFDPATRRLTWPTSYLDAGFYTISFVANDDKEPDRKVIMAVGIRVMDVAPVPPTPMNVVATDGDFPDRVRITFNVAGVTKAVDEYQNTTPGVVRYRVYRSATSNVNESALLGVWDATTVDDFSAIEFTTDDNGAPLNCNPFENITGGKGPVYYYWVTATNEIQESPKSEPDSGYVSLGATAATGDEEVAEAALIGKNTVGDLVLLAGAAMAISLFGRVRLRWRRQTK